VPLLYLWEETMIRITIENLPNDDTCTISVSLKGFGETSEEKMGQVTAAIRNKAQALIAVAQEAFNG
jgi:hypothetical protein